MRPTANKLLALLCLLLLPACSTILGFDDYTFGGDGDADGDGDSDTDTDSDSDSDGDEEECTDEGCDDGFQCTDDSCDDDDECVSELNDATCNTVTGIEDNECVETYCDPDESDDDTGCVVDYHDNDDCTPATEDYCIPEWTCMTGQCVGGDERDCSDAFACTDDSCDSAAEDCVNEPNHESCPDDPATGAPGVCAPSHPDADGDGCIVAEPCDPSDPAACDDANVCNGEETCDPDDTSPDGGYCQPGEELDCDDGHDCTHDACDPTAGCDHTPDDSLCEAGDICETPRCTVEDGCVVDPVECPDDGNPCTEDSCDATAGGCYSPTPEGVACDSWACTEDEACDGDSHCIRGDTPTDCDDENPCTVDGCEEPAGCTYEPVEDGTVCGPFGDCVAHRCDASECVEEDISVCSDDADGCCPDGCEIDEDLDCTGSGHVVFIGHDFYERLEATDILLANAVLELADVDDSETLRTLNYGQFADTSRDGEAWNMRGAINDQAAARGVDIDMDAFTNYLELDAAMLAPYHVLIVYEQETAPGSGLSMVGAAWADVLEPWIQDGGVVVIAEDGDGVTWHIPNGANLIPIEGVTGITGSRVRVANFGDPLAEEMSSSYVSPEGSAYLRPVDLAGMVVRTDDAAARPVVIRRGGPVMNLPINPESHGELTLTSGTHDDGQFNLNIAPLSFPFNGDEYGCVAVSTNGYLRFGPSGRCPAASGFEDVDTDIDDGYRAGVPQISFLATDGEIPGNLQFRIEASTRRLILTIMGYRRLGRVGTNDIQIVLYCDTGDIQISYGDENTFDCDAGEHWSIGTSEPDVLGGSFQGNDFTNHATVPGDVRTYGPGAVGQNPERTGTSGFRALAGQGILFHRIPSGGFQVLVDRITTR